jgi:putative transcriptional regulator
MIPPANGILLIAEPFLKDPNFIRSVTLLCKYDTTDGAVGFVINKPHQQKLGEMLPEMAAFDLPIFIGGPVQIDTLHFLHKYPEHFPEAPKISEGIYWGGDFELLKTLIKSGTIETNGIRLFFGYSGWDAGQLEEEIEEKSWLTVQANAQILFNTPADEIWKWSIKLLGGKYEMMINFPTDPQLN